MKPTLILLTALLLALSVRAGHLKLLCEYDGSEPQLYDLTTDRSEKNNIAAQQPTQVAKLTALLLAWHQSMPPDNGPELSTPRPTKQKK